MSLSLSLPSLTTIKTIGRAKRGENVFSVCFFFFLLSFFLTLAVLRYGFRSNPLFIFIYSPSAAGQGRLFQEVTSLTIRPIAVARSSQPAFGFLSKQVVLSSTQPYFWQRQDQFWRSRLDEPGRGCWCRKSGIFSSFFFFLNGVCSHSSVAPGSSSEDRAEKGPVSPLGKELQTLMRGNETGGRPWKGGSGANFRKSRLDKIQ